MVAPYNVLDVSRYVINYSNDKGTVCLLGHFAYSGVEMQ